MEMQKMIKYPEGYTKGDGTKQLAIRFPHALFDQITRMAMKEERNFNEMVLELIRCGKLCIEESDAMEPQQSHSYEQRA
jgi:hypothetical protein